MGAGTPEWYPAGGETARLLGQVTAAEAVEQFQAAHDPERDASEAVEPPIS